MTKRYDTAALIIHELEQQGSCTLDALAYRLPTCTWNQVFMAVDVLSREGTICLQPRARCQYLVSLASVHTQAWHQFDPGRRAAENRRNTNGSYGR
ncbi:MAG: hypothetical protein LKG23_17665 [Nitrospira sp.]|jgi:hypothetical protein|nr:hypothetical protein [Nitrospira sp.]